MLFPGASFWVSQRQRPTWFVAAFFAAIVMLSLVSTPSDAQEPKPSLTIGRGDTALPPPVAEMRDAILAAAQAGSLDELLVAIQWNELPPDFGDLSVEDTLADWKKNSKDGTGRKWLDLLARLLNAPYVIVRQGRDVENAKIYIWPAFAELPIAKLTPKLEIELANLLSPEDLKRMKAAGTYDGHALAIGADGTWHAFKKIQAQKRPK